MRAHYVRAMEVLYRFCLWTSGLCIVFITAVVPWGVFTRYVLGYGSNWPEPLAILLMIVFSML
jgi:TRAP-type C4-dicarboxylate transport system permease small subunit